MATAPMEMENIWSVRGTQFEPLSLVFQMPPSSVVIYRIWSLAPLGSMRISVTSPESGPMPM